MLKQIAGTLTSGHRIVVTISRLLDVIPKRLIPHMFGQQRIRLLFLCGIAMSGCSQENQELQPKVPASHSEQQSKGPMQVDWRAADEIAKEPESAGIPDPKAATGLARSAPVPVLLPTGPEVSAQKDGISYTEVERGYAAQLNSGRFDIDVTAIAPPFSSLGDVASSMIRESAPPVPGLNHYTFEYTEFGATASFERFNTAYVVTMYCNDHHHSGNMEECIPQTAVKSVLASLVVVRRD